MIEGLSKRVIGIDEVLVALVEPRKVALTR
jgi:hypothetical protein